MEKIYSYDDNGCKYEVPQVYSGTADPNTLTELNNANDGDIYYQYEE